MLVSSRYSGTRPTWMSPDAQRARRGPAAARSTSSGLPSGVEFGDERQGEEVVLGVALLLPAVDVQVLAEVAFAVHQADADERQAEVAGALEVVAGEDAEAAGVDRHALVDAELGGEVGDRHRRRLRIGLLKPGRGVQVVVERFRDAVHVGEEAVVAASSSNRDLVGRIEQPDGAVVERFEQVRVDAAEQGDRVGVPAPPQVVRERLEGGAGREGGQDGERMNSGRASGNLAGQWKR